MNILFTTALPHRGFLSLADHQLDIPDTPYYSADQLMARLPQADVLVSTFDYKVTAEMIAAASRLQLITNFGVGFNNIDLSAARSRHIAVTNTPLPVIEPTAELCFALMICLARRIALFDRQLRSAQAEPFGVMNNLSVSLYGKRLGIIGMGNIGQAVARRAVASGMEIVYHNRHRLPAEVEARYGATYLEMSDLLQTSDFISLNLPYTPEVHHLIGEKELSLMKPTAMLINTARGAHVDEQALVSAMRRGVIAGAAMDVYEKEPLISQELLSMDNVVLSPHTGTGTWEGRIDMCYNVADNIRFWLAGEREKMNLV